MKILVNHKRLERQRIIHLIETYRTSRAVWVAVGAGIVVSIVMIIGAITPDTLTLESNFHVIYITLTNILLFLALFIYNFWIIRTALKRVAIILCCLFGSFAISSLFTLLSHAIEPLFYGTGATSFSLSISFVVDSTFAVISFLVAMLLYNIMQYQQQVIENEHLQAENMLIHYETLERQVQPHFLFNSLNTLNGLIGVDDEKAHNYLQQLATTFRYIMQKEKVVTLEQELEFTRAYIYLMQIRHGDYLKINLNIDSALLHYQVVPISLQLLVENAIKHNIISARHPLTIDIRTTPEKTIIVSNTIQPKSDQEESSGIGLINLAQRYSIVFSKEINIVQTEENFSVEIPVI